VGSDQPVNKYNIKETKLNSKPKVKIVAFAPLSLYADTEKDKYASLTWSIRAGYPRVTVYTDNSNSFKTEFSYDNLIIAPMDSVTVNTLIANLRTVADSKETTSLTIKCYNVKYVDNVKTDEIMLQATIIVGKDDEGVVYISVTQEGKKNVVFKLLPKLKWHKFLGPDHKVIEDNSKLSTMFAKSYIARLQSLMDKNLSDSGSVVKGGQSTVTQPVVSTPFDMPY